MWVRQDDYISRGIYKSSFSCFTNPKYVNLAFLLKVFHAQYWWIFKIICPLGYLLSFSEHPNSYLFPCGYFWCYDEIVLEVHIYPFKIKLSFVLCFKQWSYWCIYDFLLYIMFITFVPILCVHVSLWTYISWLMST